MSRRQRNQHDNGHLRTSPSPRKDGNTIDNERFNQFNPYGNDNDNSRDRRLSNYRKDDSAL